MADEAPADALRAGTDEPNAVGCDAAERTRRAGRRPTKDLASSLPSSQAHDEERDIDADDTSIASGGAGRRRSPIKGQAKVKGKAASRKHSQHSFRSPTTQAGQQQRQLRKSASASTTDTVASAQTDASTEVRAAVSNRASRSALNQKAKSIASSPTIPQEAEYSSDFASQPTRPKKETLPYRGLQLDSLHDDVSDSTQNPDPSRSGIVQVNPAPPPSPPPQHRGRSTMASSFLPAIFGRRRPNSSASSITTSSFAAHNPPPPGPQDFDFSSILNSLETDDAARADIDAIAEICGHSRLSLANAHAQHRDPVGELVGTPSASSQFINSGTGIGLEPVTEGVTPRREREAKLRSPSGSQASADRWPMSGIVEREGDERELARQPTRLSGVVAEGRSASREAEGRARRHLMRVRENSGERDQARWRRNDSR